MAKSKAPKPGRPPVYDPEYHPEMAMDLMLLGKTLEEIAKVFRVDEATVYRWKNEHPEFCEALNAGGVVADAKVARSYYSRAIGYTFDKAHAFVDRHGEEHVITVREKLHPDPGAALNWLKNRQPDLWREKQQIEHSAPEGSAAGAFAIVTLSGRPQREGGPDGQEEA